MRREMSSRRARVTEGLGIWLIVVLAMGSLHRVDGQFTNE